MNYIKQLGEAQKKLRDLEIALNESSIVAITDNKGVIRFANKKFCEISKYSKEELEGSKHSIINSGYHDKSFFKDMWRTIGTGHVWKGEIKNKAKDGSYYWVDTTIVPFLKDNGKPYQYIAIRHDITSLKVYEKNIEVMAFYDPLTTLPNRNMLKKWVGNLKNVKTKNMAVLFLDIDRFKSINDKYGHNIGDSLLEKFANRIKKCLREDDLIVRQGGDEFIIILDNVMVKENVIVVIEKLIDNISAPFLVFEKKQIGVSVSIGISLGRIDSEQTNIDGLVDTLIKQADIAMYHAKKQIGNSYCFNTPNQNNELERYYKIENELRNALRNNQFHIVYQPIINLTHNTISAAEALLRWESPILGHVPPSEFIPLLEEFDLITEIGNWVLQKVCCQMKSWLIQGIKLKRICVNVSPIQFKDTSFVKNLEKILDEARLDPAYLEIEITEGTILDMKESEKILRDLKSHKIGISIDDFGTGYSSLSYLKQLPIDTLKIDKSFIKELDLDGKVIVNTIISMGEHLNHRVIAEGIETKEQLDYLKQQNCHEGQGFYWSKPINADRFQKYIEDFKTMKLKI
ncbi:MULTISPECIES: sensor domain-containing protein [Terrilactibacillus]|uniref:EAL domain-containing protein n=2 Tax=Terrilactibacillus TaxID=1795633 RepID=A0A6N8CPX8_9BACI|nr:MULTISPECIES: GGDEF domain-containing phosphodiesterase [Terrilactibacillus]MTT32081.1 EAL domain-containing protein [Terrilactibacillus tamarindi]